MTVTPEKFVTCFRATQEFVAARVNRDAVFKGIAQDLDKIRVAFDSGKLNIYVVSRSRASVQGLYQFFQVHQTLQPFYQFYSADLSAEMQLGQRSSPPALILQENKAIGQFQVRYELVSGRNIWLGRDRQKLESYPHSSNDRLLDLPLYRKISGVHAAIQEVSRPGSTPTWQILDINTTNGTYVNGQKIQDRRVLRSGDRIALAYPTASEKAPEFIFECPLNGTVHDPLSWLEHCDLVFFAINPHEILDAVEWQFLDRCSRSTLSELVMIADTADPIQPEKSSAIDFSKITSKIATQYSGFAKKISPIGLYLRPFLLGETAPLIDPNVQQQYEKICNQLIGLAKERTRVLLSDRLMPQLLLQIERISAIVESESETVKREQQRTEELLQARSLLDWKELIDRGIEQVIEEKDDFFRDTRIKLGRTKSELAEGFIQNSLMHRIKLFSDTLHPVVTRYNGQVCVQLQADGKPDTHQVMLQFCREQLVVWATEEWKHICNDYVDREEGLNGLIHRSFKTLNCLPSLTLTNSFSLPSAQLDVWDSLQGTFVEFQSNTSYIENSVDNFRLITSGVQVATAIGMATLHPIAGIVQLASASVNLIGLMNTKLNQTQLNDLKLDQVTVSLRQQIAECYKRIAAFLLNRVAQDIDTALGIEDRKFRKALRTTKEQCDRHLINLKTFTEGDRARQQALIQDKAGLEQLQRLTN